MGRRISGLMPQVRLHKASKQGLVRINGRPIYVGRYGSPEAVQRYFDLMVEHGFMPQAPAASTAAPASEPAPEPTSLPAGDAPVPAGLTVGELCYLHLADVSSSTPGGKRSGNYQKALAASRAVRFLANMPAAEFGTRALLEVRNKLIATPVANRRPDERGNVPTLCRRYTNEVVRHIRKMFDWAVLQELVPNDRVAALVVVKPLREGHTNAREAKRRTRVRPSVVKATLPYMTSEMADLVWFIRLTGCRPSEAARLRMCRVFDRNKQVWRYVPKKHKTAHRGKSRHVPIGPQAQVIVVAHSAGRSDREFVFTPQRSVPPRKARDGVIPIEPRKPTAHARSSFTKDGIMQAVRRAVIRGNKDRESKGLPPIPHWTPYQLRYTRLREIRRAGGSEAAQATAGHSRATMTDHYAPANWGKAARTAARSG